MDKRGLLAEYLNGYQTLVETGLYLGGGSGYGLAPVYHAIELDPESCRQGRANYPAGCVWEGDSGELLPLVLSVLEGPALVWLDAHLVDTIDGEQALDEHPCPLLRELEALRAWEHGAASTILIDDQRLFGSYGWPSRQQVLELLEPWDLVDAEDVLRCVPRIPVPPRTVTAERG